MFARGVKNVVVFAARVNMPSADQHLENYMTSLCLSFLFLAFSSSSCLRASSAFLLCSSFWPPCPPRAWHSCGLFCFRRTAVFLVGFQPFFGFLLLPALFLFRQLLAAFCFPPVLVGSQAHFWQALNIELAGECYELAPVGNRCVCHSTRDSLRGDYLP